MADTKNVRHCFTAGAFKAMHFLAAKHIRGVNMQIKKKPRLHAAAF